MPAFIVKSEVVVGQGVKAQVASMTVSTENAASARAAASRTYAARGAIFRIMEIKQDDAAPA